MERTTITNLIKSPVGVGRGALNNEKDVKVIKYLFNLVSSDVTSLTFETGLCDSALIYKIKRFQKDHLGFRICDGRVDPGGKTLSKLVEKAKLKYSLLPKKSMNATVYQFGGAWCGSDIAGTLSDIQNFLGFKAQPRNKNEKNQAHRIVVNNFLKLYFDKKSISERSVKIAVKKTLSTSVGLTDTDFIRAAKELGADISVNLVKAFAMVESGGRRGFGSDGLPIIAYEGHLFRKYTNNKYDETHPLLSYPYVEKAGPEWQINNKNHNTAWKTLTAAMELDVDAALMCCSWGMFQVLGANYQMTGHRSVQNFVADMKRGESGQLDAFVAYCKKKKGMIAALKTKDFRNMARLYNGENYGNYDVLIGRAYKKLSEAN